MSLPVTVEPALLNWACERNRRDVDDYARSFPKLPAWIAQREQPTLKQLEKFARATSTPIGYFFLTEPPREVLPIRDFRTISHKEQRRPSPELLDTIGDCQARQAWYRDFALTLGEPTLSFVGSVTIANDVVSTANLLRTHIRFDLDARRTMKTWEEALTRFFELVEAAGILVMRSGVVGSNTSRALDPQEFRGFTLADDIAPAVFVNGADTKSAQMFTLAHELAHVWLGQTGVSDERIEQFENDEVERWCNAVAAELLVPLAILEKDVPPKPVLTIEVPRLARLYKVSSLVILRRLHELGRIDRAMFWSAYRQELSRLSSAPSGSGGDFYRTQPARVSKRFARAVIVSTLEGQTLYRDAFRMLGIQKTSTFNGLATSLGII